MFAERTPMLCEPHDGIEGRVGHTPQPRSIVRECPLSGIPMISVAPGSRFCSVQLAGETAQRARSPQGAYSSPRVYWDHLASLALGRSLIPETVRHRSLLLGGS